MTNLWSDNTPADFWHCQPDIAQVQWETAAIQASSVLGLSHQWDDFDTLLESTLGEGQFGYHHWELSHAKNLYYRCKPFLPRSLTRGLRQMYSQSAHGGALLNWPIEDRYVRFQWELMRQLLILQGCQSIDFVHFWPQGKQFACVLTHDIETSKGAAYVRAVADLEEELGFRSSFNFVPERYRIDPGLLDELRRRGFEIGVHGLYHDGRLFSSHKEFDARAQRINHYMEAFGAVGFRSPLTMRQPEWMQALEIEYDLSFFDTDPYEPIPGGTMTIWPFMLGRFVELPYTLVQDYTLVSVLRQSTPLTWFRKVDFIRAYHGMVLLNTHPDYLLDKTTWKVYAEFLQGMSEMDGCWHVLPKEVAQWWKTRQKTSVDMIAIPSTDHSLTMGQIVLTEYSIELR